MDMLKRMQKANISSSEIPLLGIDIGGVTVKLTYFDVDHVNDSLEKNKYDALQTAKFFDKEQNDNRRIIQEYLNANLEQYRVYDDVKSNSEVRLKNLTGKLKLYLFTREYFNDRLLKELINLNLKEPFICITGAAIVNYMNILVNEIKSRVLFLSSENEGIVRGLNLLSSQKVSSFYRVDTENENNYDKLYTADILNDNFYPTLLAIIGTSTTFLRLNSPNKYTYLGSSAISGQTFIGLCNTANKLSEKDAAKNLNFDRCLSMASSGSSDQYDVTVKKLCGGSDHKVEQFLYLHNLETGLYVRKDDYIKQFGDLAISCFGDSASLNNSSDDNLNNFASASLNLVCYQIAEMLCLYSRLYTNSKHALCGGSFLINNSKAKYLIAKYFQILNRGHLKTKCKNVYFIDDEANLASLGCLAVDGQNISVEPRD